jgi:hypothetical protein
MLVGDLDFWWRHLQHLSWFKPIFSAVKTHFPSGETLWDAPFCCFNPNLQTAGLSSQNNAKNLGPTGLSSQGNSRKKRIL